MSDPIVGMIVVLNVLVWLFNFAMLVSDDKSGAGMVLILSMPLGFAVSIVSLAIVQSRL